MLENGTKLQLGPLTFTHQVQKINIQERKGVKVLEATRSKKNFVVDSGDSAAKAQIRFLFVGLDEINGILEPDTFVKFPPASNNRKLLAINQEIPRTNQNALYKDPTGNNPVDPFVLAANRKFQSAVNRAGADSAEAQLLKEQRDNAIRGVVSSLIEQGELESQRAVQTANARFDNLSSGYRIPIGLRSLIALFKCCPIVTLNNQYISSSWKKADKIYDKQNYKKLKDYLEDLTLLNQDISSQNDEQLKSLVSDSVENTDPADLAVRVREAVKNNLEITKKLNTQLAQYKDSITPDESLDFMRGATFSDYHFGSVQFPDNFLQQNVTYSSNVSVALESLELENVPDIPYAIQVTLTIARIDTAPYTEGNELEYLGPVSLDDKRENPKDAYWLRKWIVTLLEKNEIPELTANDFKTANFAWYGKSAINTQLVPPDAENSFYLNLTSQQNKSSDSLLISENCSIRHKFAYNKIIGKIFPTAAHMGSTARFLSLDIVFNNQKSYDLYNKFCRFKYTSDEINKERERFDRITGWEILTPISKLLSNPRLNIINSNSPKSGAHAGVYVPLSIITENGQQPDMINCRIDLIENNVDFFSDNEIVLESGGTDYSGLKKYFEELLNKEIKFRILLNNNKKEALNLIVGNNPQNNASTDYSAYFTFWPIEKGLLSIKEESGFGILNVDTLRATVLKMDDPKYGGSGKLKEALYKSPIITGTYFANRKPTAADTVAKNVEFAISAFFGEEGKDNPDIKPIYDELLTIVKRSFIDTNNIISTVVSTIGIDQRDLEAYRSLNENEFFYNITDNLIIGFTGDRTNGFIINNSATGEVIKLLSKSNADFSSEFTRALFDVLVERRPKPSGLPYIYSTDGVYAGFYKLILGYDLDKDKIINPEQLRKDLSDDIVKKNTNKGNQSLFPDLLLPTYRDLYGDDWQEFAPTVQDLGIVVDQEPTAMPDKSSILAVSESDFVSPSAWFYVKRNKKQLRESLSNTVKAAKEAMPKLSITVPFNSHDIEVIKEAIKTKNSSLPGSERYKNAESSLHEKIRDSFLKYKESNPSGFRENVVNILTAGEKLESIGEKFSGRYLSGGEETLHLQERNNGSYVVPRNINVPGVAAEIYRVLKKDKYDLLEEVSPSLLDPEVEATYVTPLNRQAAFLRNSKNQTEACLNSSLDQIADDHTSPERMFPAIKIYLIDRRGTDLIADDTLFNVNSIISVDITMDKDDAPVAVIRLADPLYFLQSSYFDQKNIVYTNNSKGQTPQIDKVFNSLRGTDRDSFLKRYKIAQGRAIQIRMGYSSMAYNLPIVFTGRIAEIAPGDELVLVCQGWKAELISRQVNFYNDDTKNWGARDLAIQAITYSNPDGFGDVYPEADAQFILRNMDPTEVSLALDNIRQNRNNIDLENVGSRTFSEGVSNWFSSMFTTTSTDKRNLGLDTRLKNIWYPDTQLYSNVLGIRSFFNVMPSWLNDSWIVPMQPAWDVLKEASRHAWNCIVDVIPYDGQATIFMGHPDQPYYYTRGDAFSRKTFRERYRNNTKKLNETFKNLYDSFTASEYYRASSLNTNRDSLISQEDADSIIKRLAEKYGRGITPLSAVPDASTIPNTVNTQSQIADKEEFEKLSLLISKDFTTVASLFKDTIKIESTLAYYLKGFNRSAVPSAKLQEVINQGGFGNIGIYLFAYFYGIPIGKVATSWPTINNDLPRILINIDEALKNEEVKSRVEGLINVSGVKNFNVINSLIFDIDSTVARYQQYDLRNDFSSNPSVGAFDLIDVRRRSDQLLGYIVTKLAEIERTIAKDIPGIIPNIEQFKNEATDLLDEWNLFFDSSLSSPLLPSLDSLTEKQRSILNKRTNTKTKPDQDLFLKIKDFLIKLRDGEGNNSNDFIPSIISKIGLSETSYEILGTNTGNFILDYLPIFKAFVFFFSCFLLENQTDVLQDLSQTVQNFDNNKLPPNMKVFRVHHFADDTHNIISNNIVASTKEMWNTVVIEHPSPGSANDAVEDKDVFKSGTLSAGINWVYWPKQEITGVLGLQFHPGLTLANKKIKVFTELNCQTTDLAAKLACVHLADGIKKMYRGNLSLLGKHVKPHDRIILADSYTKMVGPIEVESIVHHWNADQGWVTNIIPNAVCDANPASGVLHTAALEATFQSVFNIVEFAADLFTYATIIATLGGATPLAVGSFSVRKGLISALKTVLSPKSAAGRFGNALKLKYKRAAKGLGGDWRKGSRVGLIKSLYREVGGPVNALLANEVAQGAATYGPSLWFKHTAISAYLEIGDKAEQLPVIFTPLLFNGNPFTAGLETEDSIWAIGAFNSYYSMKEIQAGASRALEDFLEYIGE